MAITFEAYTTKTLTARLHRAPRLALAATAGARVVLHRSAQLALTGSHTIAGSMTLHRAPRLRLSDRAGALILLHRTAQLALSMGAPIPEATVIALASQPHQLQLRTVLTHTLTAQLYREPRLLMAGSGARVLLHRAPRLFLHDNHYSADRTAVLLQQPEIYASASEGMTFAAQSGVSLAGTPLVTRLTYVLADAFGLHADPARVLQILKQLDTRFGLAELIDAALLARMNSTLGLGDQLTAGEYLLLALADTMALAAGPSATQDTARVLAAILALADTLDTPTREQLLTAIGLSSSLAPDVYIYAAALDALRIAAVVTGGLLLTATLADSFALGDTPLTTAELLAALQSAVGLAATLQIDGQAYTAWVMDLESKAAWTYDNYPFNSFARIGDRLFGAGPDGISELTGADDAGTPIAWSVQTGLLNFGSAAEKRIDAMYLGYTSTGTVGLAVITTSPDGEKVQYNYTMVPRTANTLVENRIKVGRGLKSVYFQFQLAGTGDFALHDAQLLPMLLSRKV